MLQECEGILMGVERAVHGKKNVRACTNSCVYATRCIQIYIYVCIFLNCFNYWKQ